MWATYNVGATSPEESGNYYAWGEVFTKNDYTEDSSETYGKNMGDISGNPQYDAATANWGGAWRMPTQVEIQELVENCTWIWITHNGVNGYKVIGPSGQYIFLPAAGYRIGYEWGIQGVDYSGSYWSSTPNGWDDSSYILNLNDVEFSPWYGNYRYYGCTVRPVRE